MFVWSKLLSAGTQPVTWLILWMALGWWWGRRHPARGRALMGVGLAVMVLLGWRPLPDALVRSLEQQVPAPAPPADARWADFAGVVVLGGALENAFVRSGNGQVGLNSAAERMTMAVALARAHPRLKIVFTGGDGTLLRQPESEAVQARQFFAEMGVDPDRLVFESASRTTYENALFSARLPGVDIQKPWILLTSGWHMPRSVASFKKVGWQVTPYSVDYLTGNTTPWADYGMAGALTQWQRGIHEALGLWAYRLSSQAE
ncbi:YdcF family protein [Xylophilus sp. Kf1]|nr:YdcF family protein [Xylophilus sp. Kf1]